MAPVRTRKAPAKGPKVQMLPIDSLVPTPDNTRRPITNSQAEETRGFFVAFSRAMKRVLFTFAQERPRYPGRPPESQRRTSIGRLYDLLKEAGIEPEDIEC